MTLAEAIKSKMTYKNLADKIGVHPTLVAHWIKGRKRIMPYHVRGIAKALNMPLGDIADMCNVDNSLIPVTELVWRLRMPHTTIHSLKKYYNFKKIGCKQYIERQEYERMKQDLAFPTNDKYIKLADVARMLNYDERRLVYRANRGIIPAYKRKYIKLWYVRELDIPIIKKIIDKGV